jgi:Arm DNA-binding domain
LDQLIKSLTSKGTCPRSEAPVESTAPSASDVFAWDNELRGFGMRVKPSGLRSYIVQYRNAHGRSKRMTIGGHARLTAEETRKHARQILAEVEKGGDSAKAVMPRRRRRQSPSCACATLPSTQVPARSRAASRATGG